MGTTADKGEYLNTTKSLLKDKINNLGGDITDETTFRNYANQLQNVYDNLPKTEYQEGTEVNLGKTIKGKLDYDNGAVGIGQTNQETTTGINLLNTSGYSETKAGLSISADNNGIITLNGTCDTDNTSFYIGNYTASTPLSVSANTNLYIKIFYVSGTYTNNNTSSRNANFRIYDGNYSGKSFNFTINNTDVLGEMGVQSSNKDYVHIGINASSNMIFNNYKIKIMVSYTNLTSSTPFEKYTGGQASPNPSYPQAINSVTGNQEVVVSGKNLFDKNNPNVLNAYFTTNAPTITSADSNRTIYLPCKPSTNYCVRKIDSNVFNFGCTREVPTIRNTSIQCKC